MTPESDRQSRTVRITVLDEAIAFIRRLANQPAAREGGYGRTTEQIKADAQSFMRTHGLS